MISLISAEDFDREVELIAKTTELSKSRARELIAEGLGYKGGSYRKHTLQHHDPNQSGDFILGEPIEQMCFYNLTLLKLKIEHALNSHLPAYERVTSVSFIEREFERKRKQYLAWDNGYPLTSHLLLLPYLLGGTGEGSDISNPWKVSEEHIDLCYKSILSRYYPRFAVDAIGHPYYGDEQLCRKAWVEKFLSGSDSVDYSFPDGLWEVGLAKTKPCLLNSAESFITRVVANDILAGGDGTNVRNLLCSKYSSEEFFHPIKGIFESSLQLPSLRPVAYGVGCACEYSFLCCKVPDCAPEGVLSSESFPELSFRFPLVLSAPNVDPSIRLTREDLSSGLALIGAPDSGVYEHTLMSQLIKSGLGLVYCTSGDRLASELMKVDAIASKYGRAREVLCLSASMTNKLTPSELRSALTSKKIILVESCKALDVAVLRGLFESALDDVESNGMVVGNSIFNTCLFADMTLDDNEELAGVRMLFETFAKRHLWRVSIGGWCGVEYEEMVRLSDSTAYRLEFDDEKTRFKFSYKGEMLSDRLFDACIVEIPRTHFVPVFNAW